MIKPRKGSDGAIIIICITINLIKWSLYRSRSTPIKIIYPSDIDKQTFFMPKFSPLINFFSIELE